MQLIDISGKMEVIQSAPVDPEPHYGQMIKADKIKTIEVYPKDEKNPYAVFNQKIRASFEKEMKCTYMVLRCVRNSFLMRKQNVQMS